jgi:hypothetical protein
MIVEHEKIRSDLNDLRNKILAQYFGDETICCNRYSTYSDIDLPGNRSGSMIIEEYRGSLNRLFLVIWFDVGNWRIRIRRFNDKETMLKEMGIHDT